MKNATEKYCLQRSLQQTNSRSQASAVRLSFLREYQNIPVKKSRCSNPHLQLSLQTETVEEPIEEEEAKEKEEETDDEAAVEEEEEEKKPKTKKVSFVRLEAL